MTECLIWAENEQVCLGQNKVFILTSQQGGTSEKITQRHMQLWNVVMLAAKQGRYPKGQIHILMHLQSALFFGCSWSLFWKRAKCTQKYWCMTCLWHKISMSRSVPVCCLSFVNYDFELSMFINMLVNSGHMLMSVLGNVPGLVTSPSEHAAAPG